MNIHMSIHDILNILEYLNKYSHAHSFHFRYSFKYSILISWYTRYSFEHLFQLWIFEKNIHGYLWKYSFCFLLKLGYSFQFRYILKDVHQINSGYPGYSHKHSFFLFGQHGVHCVRTYASKTWGKTIKDLKFWVQAQSR